MIAAETRMDREEKQILVLTSASHFLCHFSMLVFPAIVMPVSRDLGLPLASVLSMGFWMYLLYGVLALGWGWVSDHWGHKWALGSGMLLAALGFFAASASREPLSIALSLAAVGMGCSAYHPAGIALVSQGVRQRGRAMGINGIWGNVGIAGAPFVMGVLNYALGWRRALQLVGLAGLSAGALALSLPLVLRKGEDRKEVTPLPRRLATRLFALFCVGLVFNGLIYRSFTVILPAFLEHRLGNLTQALRALVESFLPGRVEGSAFDTLAANLVATSVYLLGIVGQIIGGRVADRYSLKWSYLVSFLCALPFVLAMALLPGNLLVVAGGVFLLFNLGAQPIENSLIAYLTPPKWRSLSYAVKFTLVFGVGSFAVKLMEYMERTHGIDAALLPIPGFVLLLVLNTIVFLLASRGMSIRH